MTIDFKQKKGFNFEIDLEKSTSFSDLKLYIENSIDESLEFFELEKNGWNYLKHRMYFLNCLCSFEAEKGMLFSYYESDLNSSKVPCLYQIEKDNPIGNGTLLKFDVTIIPLAYQSITKNQFTHEICIDICEKYFARINRKYFDFINKEDKPELNDILAVVEESANGLVITTFENIPTTEKIKVGFDSSNDAGDSMAYALHGITKEKEQQNEFEQLLTDIDNTIEKAQNDKLPYSERSKYNTKLSVYAYRLAHLSHIEGKRQVYEKHQAERQEYKYYAEYMSDPKNTAENGKRPSDAAAKNYAGKMTLELFQQAEISEQIVKNMILRIKTIAEIMKAVSQEVANAKKEIEQTKQLT